MLQVLPLSAWRHFLSWSYRLGMLLAYWTRTRHQLLCLTMDRTVLAQLPRRIPATARPTYCPALFSAGAGLAFPSSAIPEQRSGLQHCMAAPTSRLFGKSWFCAKLVQPRGCLCLEIDPFWGFSCRSFGRFRAVM